MVSVLLTDRAHLSTFIYMHTKHAHTHTHTCSSPFWHYCSLSSVAHSVFPWQIKCHSTARHIIQRDPFNFPTPTADLFPLVLSIEGLMINSTINPTSDPKANNFPNELQKMVHSSKLVPLLSSLAGTCTSDNTVETAVVIRRHRIHKIVYKNNPESLRTWSFDKDEYIFQANVPCLCQVKLQM